MLLYFYPERPALNARSLFGASTGLYMPETDKNDTAESSSAAVPTYSGDSAKDKSKFTGWKALVENWLSGYIGVDEGDLKEHPLPHPLSYYVFERPERPADSHVNWDRWYYDRAMVVAWRRDPVESRTSYVLRPYGR